ncbi:MAG TPA: hypothetical protein PKG48_02210 [Bacteroidales bacterium]|nr:hypothetical protein [Bacteroidales bacterium]HPS61988.1 hypothetical protein [Bacteroidales bacterium]
MNENYQVNWINGMKITADHFIGMEDHFIHRVQQTVRGLVHPLNYGLVPGNDENVSLPHFSVSFNKDRLTVLHGFTALSPEGHLFQVPGNQDFPLSQPQVQSEWYYLIVSGRPFSRAPFGTIDTQENPARYPYAMQDFRFEFFAANRDQLHVLEPNTIPLGRYHGSSFEEDKTYIPPCTSIQAHPELISLYKVFQESFSELERKIITLVRSKDHQNNPLLAQLIGFFGNHKTAIDQELPYLPPYALFEKAQQAARIFHYYYKIQNREALNDIVDFRYNHFDIRRAADVIYSFIRSHQQFLPFDARYRP